MMVGDIVEHLLQSGVGYNSCLLGVIKQLERKSEMSWCNTVERLARVFEVVV